MIKYCVEMRGENEDMWRQIVWSVASDDDPSQKPTLHGLYDTREEAQHYVDDLKWAEQIHSQYQEQRVYARVGEYEVKENETTRSS